MSSSGPVLSLSVKVWIALIVGGWVVLAVAVLLGTALILRWARWLRLPKGLQRSLVDFREGASEYPWASTGGDSVAPAFSCLELPIDRFRPKSRR